MCAVPRRCVPPLTPYITPCHVELYPAPGLLTRGLHAALEEYVRISRDIAYERGNAHVNSSTGEGTPSLQLIHKGASRSIACTLSGTITKNGVTQPYSIPAVLNGADFDFIRTMNEKYLDEVSSSFACTVFACQVVYSLLLC